MKHVVLFARADYIIAELLANVYQVQLCVAGVFLKIV